MLLHFRSPKTPPVREREVNRKYDLEEAQFPESLDGPDTFEDFVVGRLYRV